MTRPPTADRPADLERFLADLRNRFPTERYVDQTLTRKMHRRAPAQSRRQITRERAR